LFLPWIAHGFALDGRILLPPLSLRLPPRELHVDQLPKASEPVTGGFEQRPFQTARNTSRWASVSAWASAGDAQGFKPACGCGQVRQCRLDGQ